MSEPRLRTFKTQTQRFVPSSQKTGTTYKPSKTVGNPFDIFDSVYTEGFHRDTVVWASTRRRQDTNDYDIRQYPMQPIEDSSHPIEKAMKTCLNSELTKMQHVLMPLHIFDDVKNQLFYTVSEETSITLGGFLHGAKACKVFLRHDEIWSIVKQFLSGIRFLVSQGLQHNKLHLQSIVLTSGGVVKIAAIDHITEERPEERPKDWTTTVEAIQNLAKSLIQVSDEPCLRCAAEICGGHAGRQRCNGSSMLADAHSLNELLDNSRTLTSTSMSFQSMIQQTLSGAQLLPFIRQAKGSRIRLIIKLVWKQILPNATPAERSVGTITSVSLGDCEGQSSNEARKSLKSRIGQPPRKPRGDTKMYRDRKMYRRRTRRWSNVIERIGSEKK